MDQELPVKIVGVKFSRIGKNYFFYANHLNEIEAGDFVVVETSRGWQIGEVAELLNEIDTSMKPGMKKVDRKATPEDLIKKQELNVKEEIAVKNCMQIIRQLNIHGVKIISAEIGFDEKTMSVLYSSPEEEEIKGLDTFQNRLRDEYLKLRVELHKIGPRDAAKYFGGMGACGLESRCCTKFLDDFQSISIKMAKVQQISLTPSDITGMCDRLRCCLNYEYHQYEEILRDLPKRNQLVTTPFGEGRVIDIIPLQNKVVVGIAEEGEKVFDVEEISILSQPDSNIKEKFNFNPRHHRPNIYHKK